MARAIDSEVAFRFLTEQIVKETGAFSKGVNKGLNIARSAIRNPDAIPTLTPPNEWVSAKDNPPQLTGKYICCVEDTHGHMWSIPADYLLEMKTWVGEFGEIKNKVVYWMPLPAPPESQKKGEK